MRKDRPRQSKAKNLLDALLLRAEEVLSKLYDLRIPFTNNPVDPIFVGPKCSKRFMAPFTVPQEPPLTVTSAAKLYSCSLDAADVNIASGEISYDKVTIKEHPYLLYEYPLPRFLQHAPLEIASVIATNGWERFIRLDILVINSSAFSEILTKLAAPLSSPV